MSRTRWPQTTSASPVPDRCSVTGSSSSSSAGTVTTSAPLLRGIASAGRRSNPTGTAASNGSPASPSRVVTPAGSSVLICRRASEGGASRSGRTRSSGVKRHSSSRPVMTGNASGSRLVMRSGRTSAGERGVDGLTLVAMEPSVTPPVSFRAARSEAMTSLIEGDAALLANRALHLELDEPVELQRVLHRQLAGDRLDEPAHDHRHRLVLGQTAAHQVEELVLADLADRRLVSHLHVVLADVDVGIGVGAADRVDEQRVALHRALAVVAARLDLHEPAVGRPTATTRDALADDRARRVWRGVHHL